MATESQIAANRKNAQRSTGPRTLEGKANSAANATKHGLSGAFRVLETENQDEFDDLLAINIREFQPATSYEQFLVEEMVQSRWLLARARRLEADLIDDLTAARECADAEEMLRKAYRADTARALTNLQRQAAAHQRAAFRARDQLQNLRKQEAREARELLKQNEPNLCLTPLPPSPPTAIINAPASPHMPTLRPGPDFQPSFECG